MNPTMNRREVLARVAALMGGALSAPAVLGVLNGCSAKPKSGWKPVFLSDEQGAMVTEVAEIMIPRTETPGAADMGVPAFIDTMLKDVYGAEDQQRYIAGLKEFEAQSQSQHGHTFLALEPEQRIALVQSVHDAAIEAQRKASQPRSERRRPFILMTKELTLLGFFTSEAGATQVLQYLPIPGVLHACIPISQAGNGKTWATDQSDGF